MDGVTGLIVDIVRSRGAADRSRSQAAVRETFARADEIASAHRPLWATAGDEFQAVYADLRTCLRATTLVRTMLPDDVDCRFGMGEGSIRDVEVSDTGHVIQDGSAWWHAREAIDTVHGMQDRGHPALRTWFRGGDPRRQGFVNAFLATRDHIVSRMKARERRLTARHLAGWPQTDIAREEKISQPAVSQTLARCGANELELALDAMRDV